MCNKSFSESGQPCGFEPCEAYKRLEEENAALRQERDHLAGIVEKADMLAREVKTGAKREWVAYQKYQEARRGR